MIRSAWNRIEFSFISFSKFKIPWRCEPRTRFDATKKWAVVTSYGNAVIWFHRVLSTASYKLFDATQHKETERSQSLTQSHSYAKTHSYSMLFVCWEDSRRLNEGNCILSSLSLDIFKRNMFIHCQIDSCCQSERRVTTHPILVIILPSTHRRHYRMHTIVYSITNDSLHWQLWCVSANTKRPNNNNGVQNSFQTIWTTETNGE